MTNIGELEHFDATIAIFAKILKNQIDEGFYNVQQQIAQSVKQYTKEALRERWPQKSEPDIKKIIERLTLQKLKLDDTIWQKLLCKLYPQGNPDIQQRVETTL